VDMIGLLGDKARTRKALQYKKAMDQLSAYSLGLKVRSPLHRSKSAVQTEMDLCASHDIKATTSILVDGIDADVAELVMSEVCCAIGHALLGIKEAGNKALSKEENECSLSE